MQSLIGIVLSIQDIEDIDFQSQTTSLAVRWSGFVHPHLDVKFEVSIGSLKGSSDIVAPIDPGPNMYFVKDGLQLQYFNVSMTVLIPV